jgi:retron-type reverse transcriptase
MTKKTASGKIREIYKLPYFPDRIIHHAIIQIVEPIWFKSLIRDTYSSIKGRGIHDGVKRIKIALFDKENTTYCLKMDVKKFYPSVDNEILKQIISRKIKDKDLLWLLNEIIDSTKGIPIGNYLSQYFGNLYLSELDHLCKSKTKYYFRYCDDMVILHKDKKHLHQLKDEIESFLNNNLHLQLKQNWQVFPVQIRGIDFLGYRFFHTHTLLRNSIKKNFIKSIRKINKRHETLPWTIIVNSVMSYFGWFKYANCKNLQNKYINKDIAWIMKHTCIEQNIKNPLRKAS